MISFLFFYGAFLVDLDEMFYRRVPGVVSPGRMLLS
jgi:hypothetical protein